MGQGQVRVVEVTQTGPGPRGVVHEDLDRAAAAFQALVDGASPRDLRGRSRGTRWTNEQLLFHLLFGYLIVRALLVLVRVFGRLPRAVSVQFARLLDAGTRPFNVVNYLGSCIGGRLVRTRRMTTRFDRVISSLHRHLDRETDADLARSMHYPTRWDPFFTEVMTLLDVYRYPAQHFDFHRRQLTLPGAATVPDVRGN